MASRLNPYISFDGQAREALEFYQSVFGGDLNVNTFGQFGQSGPDENKIMHGQLETPAGYTLMVSDTAGGTPYNPGDNITVSISGDDDAALRGYFEGLSNGGQILMPLEKQMWGDVFGMCTDKFGIGWLVNIAGDAAS